MPNMKPMSPSTQRLLGVMSDLMKRAIADAVQGCGFCRTPQNVTRADAIHDLWLCSKCGARNRLTSNGFFVADQFSYREEPTDKWETFAELYQSKTRPEPRRFSPWTGWDMSETVTVSSPYSGVNFAVLDELSGVSSRDFYEPDPTRLVDWASLRPRDGILESLGRDIDRRIRETSRDVNLARVTKIASDPYLRSPQNENHGKRWLDARKAKACSADRLSRFDALYRAPSVTSPVESTPEKRRTAALRLCARDKTSIAECFVAREEIAT